MDRNIACKGRVLVIDDEFPVRDSISRWLCSEGYQAQPAASASEALEEVRLDAYDLALIDIKMPGMDGMELWELLRQVRPQLQAIVITGFPSGETEEQASRRGAFAYVTKPVDPDELSRLVSEALGGGGRTTFAGSGSLG